MRGIGAFLAVFVLIGAFVTKGNANDVETNKGSTRVAGRWHFERLLYEKYGVEKDATPRAFEIIRTEVLKKNGIGKVRGESRVVFPSYSELLRDAGLPDELRHCDKISRSVGRSEEPYRSQWGFIV
jgi:hypothetical protein